MYTCRRTQAQALRAWSLRAFLSCSESACEDAQLGFPPRSGIPPPNTHSSNKANRQGYLKNDPNDVN